MANNLTIEKYFREIEDISSHEDQLIMMVRGLIELFPLLNTYFFRFSPIGYVADGTIAIDENSDLIPIKNVQDDLRSLPNIFSAIKNRRAEFISSESYLTHSPNFPDSPVASSMLIVPICLSANVAGYSITTRFENNFSPDKNILDALTFYGKRFGKLIERLYNYYPMYSLSKRETEVMQQLAYGYSVKEIAYTINISEHTVKDYIKSAIRKTRAENRLHAVVVLLRKGIIA